MWFAIHVKPRKENQAVDILSKTAQKAGVQELFCPRSVVEVPKGDELVEEEWALFPGIVFAVAPSKWELRACLRKAKGMEYLYDATPCFDALEDDEASFIDGLAPSAERTVDLSEGIIDAAGYVRISSGPLLGLERQVLKYGKKKRLAFLGASIAGVQTAAQVGLHITRNDNAKRWE